jgi:ADP-heptose:LPS heptosyltransferase
MTIIAGRYHVCSSVPTLSEEPHRILILRTGGIGDVVLTLPCVEAIRATFPRARIGYLVEDRAAPLLLGHPALDRVHVFRRFWIQAQLRRGVFRGVLREISIFLKELQGERYDLVVDLQRNLKAGILAMLSGARERIGFSRPIAIELNSLFPGKKIFVSPSLHWKDRFLSLAYAIGAEEKNWAPRFPEDRNLSLRIEEFLKGRGITRFAVLHPSAGPFDRNRLWIPERFGEVASRITAIYRLPVVVTFGTGEEELASRVIRGSQGTAIPFDPGYGLMGLVELYRRAILYIGCDTGPMHIASALGVPCVVLFGSGDPDRYRPWSNRSRIVARRGEKGRLLPLVEIGVEEVMDAIAQILMPSEDPSLPLPSVRS